MNTTVVHMNILSDPQKININLNFLSQQNSGWLPIFIR